MSAPNASSPRSPANSMSVGQSGGPSGGSELEVFSLRDTLNGIQVREANFAEFLVALKKFGPQAGKQ